MIDYKFVDSIPITDIAKSLGLIKKGTNYMCPNKTAHENGDSNPSLSLMPNDGTFNCFGCGASGKSLDLIGLTLGTDRKGAYDWFIRSFGESKKNKAPVKFPARYISGDTKRRFVHLVNPKTRLAEMKDIIEIHEKIRKKWTVDAMYRAGVMICDAPYSIVFPNSPQLNYFGKSDSKKAFVVEGRTDYISAISAGLHEKYNIVARATKSAKFSLPTGTESAVFLIDPDDNVDNVVGKCLNMSSEIHGISLNFGDEGLAAFDCKDLSDFILEYDIGTLGNLIDLHGRDVRQQAPSFALRILGKRLKSERLRLIHSFGVEGLCEI